MKHCPQVEGGDASPLFIASEVTAWVCVQFCTRDTESCWTEFSEGSQICLRALLLWKSWVSWNCSEKKAQEESYQCIEVLAGRVQIKMESDSFSCCPGTGQEAVGTEVLMAPSEHQETFFLLWGWPKTGTSCLELWSLLPGDVNELIWSWSALVDLATVQIGLNDARSLFQPYQTALLWITIYCYSISKICFSTGSWFGNYIPLNLNRTYKNMMKINLLCLRI